MSDALFERLDTGEAGQATVLPTGFSRGPWSPDALHGGPVAALVAGEAEALLATTFEGPYVPTRFTLDLERPVPLAPLTVSSEVVRPGRKVQIVEVTVSDESSRRLARGSVLVIRRDRQELPGDLIGPDDAPPPPPPERPSGFEGWGFPIAHVAYHQNATEHRLVKGSVGAPGPVVDWIRLVVPVTAGTTPTPFQRVAAASDFLNGVSWTLSGADWIFINPDLTVTLHRLPVGDQIAVDAVTRIDPGGTGTAEADLYDTHGRLGRAVQTLLIEHR
ncbi:MAG TPA: thioesterase family protein [Acidimicrobiales bacterium]|nr:thioesterase family protein [Acidimicrobiales bacterium]